MPKFLSKFVFNKLIYDYLTDKLDASRLQKFEQKMNAEHDCADQVLLVKKSMAFVKSLEQIKAKPEICQEVMTVRKDFKYYYANRAQLLTNKYVKNPFVLILTVVMVGSFYLLLKSIDGQAVQLVVGNYNKIKNYIQKSRVERPDPKVSSQFILPQSVDDNLEKSKTAFAAQSKLEAPRQPEQAFPKNINKNIVKESMALQGKVPQVSEVSKSAVQDHHSAKTKALEGVEKKTRGPKGELIRAYMSLARLDVNGPAITDIIKSFGGEKAGEKELGFKKEKGRYFHLQISKQNEEALFNQLQGLGRIRINKEKHWRQMPEGSSRVILWVEDLDLKAQRLKGR